MENIISKIRIAGQCYESYANVSTTRALPLSPLLFSQGLQTALCLYILIVKSVHYKIQLSYILCKSSLIVS